MDALTAAQFTALIARRDYRAIATELVRLENLRGVTSMVELGEYPDEAVYASPELILDYDPSPRGHCSVYGYYRPGSPARIVVHPAYNNARDSFTIVHEYGHHVQRQHSVWADVLYGLSKGASEALEERVADAFAAEVLIPADMVSFDSAWLNAGVLAQVHQNVQASRSAVAMRAVEVAPSNDSATVVVCDSDGVVIFARAAGDDVFTPARGLAQPGLAALFGSARATGTASGEIRDGLISGSNWIQGDIRGDLALDYTGFYAFAVLRSTQKYGREQNWEQVEAECANPACELVFLVDATVVICGTCKDPRCPSCSTCSCEPPAAKTCTNCFMQLSVAEQTGELEHVCD